jgi:2',3'-cyclic-nucleotide 2'-phosphodiesterase (5'-nucleotidase family)
MVADAATTLPGVDFSLVNLSAVKIPRIPAGQVTPGDILRLSPSNNYLIVVGLKPADIRALIGQRSDLISPAGFNYTARRGPEPEEFLQVEELTYPNGEKLDETKIYYLAIDNFLFSRHLRELPFSSENTGVTTVNNIIDYLKENPDVDYQNSPPRAKLIE